MTRATNEFPCRRRRRARPLLHPLPFAAALSLIVCLVSCGGGGGTFSDGGIGGSGLIVGPVEGLGSIIVEGIEFDTAAATILVNGDNAAQADLQLGMMVAIDGLVDSQGLTGVADEVVFEESVSGPISTVSYGMKRIRLLGQTVFYDTDTVFSSITAAQLAMGVVVGVSGFVDADGDILATRIEKRNAAENCRVTGTIRNLSLPAATFDIRNLSVDASGATVIGGALADGVVVSVFASSCSGAATMAADRVRLLEATDPMPQGAFRNVQGFVLERLGNAEFRMSVFGHRSDRNVRLGSDTVVQGGSRSDIVRGARVAVIGTADAGDAIDAARVRIVRSAP